MVSAAAGAVGSLLVKSPKARAAVWSVSQVEEKCGCLTQELGFDTAIDTAVRLAQRPHAGYPPWLLRHFRDCRIMATVMRRMTLHGRV
jgi:NADPH-dependent curcumin reductase CurA